MAKARDRPGHWEPPVQRWVPTFPTPPWLQDVLPTAVQVYGADREEGAAGAVDGAQAEASETTRPVVLSCPQCAGTLKITADSERIVPCSYCDVDVYLPDAIWLRLHPVKVVRHWYLRLEGDYQALKEQRRAARKAAREQA